MNQVETITYSDNGRFPHTHALYAEILSHRTKQHQMGI